MSVDLTRLPADEETVRQLTLTSAICSCWRRSKTCLTRSTITAAPPGSLSRELERRAAWKRFPLSH